jgi:regulator of sigma E protease
LIQNIYTILIDIRKLLWIVEQGVVQSPVMDILIFIVVLVVLIVVHELGHFAVAKWSGMRVDEFGLGYPPRALVLGTKNGTTYTLNWLPFGGFVKIHGEDGEDLSAQAGQDAQSFSRRPRVLQALVLVAGIAMNLLLAYVLIVSALLLGSSRSLAPDEVAEASGVHLGILQVISGTPAGEAGIRAGDSIISADYGEGTWFPSGSMSFPEFVAGSGGEEIDLLALRGGEEIFFSATPELVTMAGGESRYLLGVEVAVIGVVQLSFFEAILEGAEATWNTIVLTTFGLLEFFAGVFTLSADLKSVAGPIGIASVVGSASAQGFSHLISITAIISINLALINLIPIPALDGGRLLFVIVESVIRRPIRAGVAQTANAIGFFLLLLLMVIVSVHDVFNIIVG